MPPVADWLPRALRDAPADSDGAPRLLDALLAGVERQRRAARRRTSTSSGTTSSSRAAPTGRCPTSARCSACRPTPSGSRSPTPIALRRRKGTPAALEDFAEVVTGLTARVLEGWQVTRLGAAARATRRRCGSPRSTSRDGSRFRIGTPFERMPPELHAVGAVVAARRDRRRVALAGAHLPRAGGRAAARAAPLRAAPAGGPGAALPEAAAAAAAERRRRRAARPHRRRARCPGSRDLPRGRGARRPGQITYGTNWTIGDRPSAGAGAGPLRRRCSTLTLDGAPVPWDEAALRRAAAGRAGAGAAAADEAVVDLARGSVELGSRPDRHAARDLAPAGARRTGRACQRRRRRPGGARGRDVNPAAVGRPAGREHARRRVHQGRGGQRRPRPDDSTPGHPDVEIRLATSDRLAAPPPQSFTPTLPRWRDRGAPHARRPTVVGELEPRPGGMLHRRSRASTSTGDLQARARASDGVVLAYVTMDPAAGPHGAASRPRHGAPPLRPSAGCSARSAPTWARTAALVEGLRSSTGWARSLRVCGGSPRRPRRATRWHAQRRFDPALVARRRDVRRCRYGSRRIDAVDCAVHRRGRGRAAAGGLPAPLLPRARSVPRRPRIPWPIAAARSRRRPSCRSDSRRPATTRSSSSPTTRCSRPRATAARSAPTTTRVACVRIERASAADATSSFRSACSWPEPRDLGGMMTGDYTKVPLRPDERWTGARMQQGRVLLDHEWNLEPRCGGPRRAATRAPTIIGPAGVVRRQPRVRGRRHASGTLDVTVTRDGCGWTGSLAYAPAPFTYTDQEQIAGAPDDAAPCSSTSTCSRSTCSRPRIRPTWSTRRWRAIDSAARTRVGYRVRVAPTTATTCAQALGGLAAIAGVDRHARRRRTGARGAADPCAPPGDPLGQVPDGLLPRRGARPRHGIDARFAWSFEDGANAVPIVVGCGQHRSGLTPSPSVTFGVGDLVEVSWLARRADRARPRRRCTRSHERDPGRRRRHARARPRR